MYNRKEFPKLTPNKTGSCCLCILKFGFYLFLGFSYWDFFVVFDICSYFVVFVAFVVFGFIQHSIIDIK
jgi:hypothetical protein